MDKLYLVLGDTKVELGDNVSRSAVDELKEVEDIDLRSELRAMLGDDLEQRVDTALDTLINEYLEANNKPSE